MADAELRQIDWASARIADGTLTVEFTGKGSKAWKARFESVLALLDTPHAAWDAVRLTKSAVEVLGVQQGAEPELRHFLESLVLQANSDIQPEAPKGDAESDDADRERDVDEQMAETFRAFAQPRED